VGCLLDQFDLVLRATRAPAPKQPPADTELLGDPRVICTCRCTIPSREDQRALVFANDVALGRGSLVTPRPSQFACDDSANGRVDDPCADLWWRYGGVRRYDFCRCEVRCARRI
jgi:hypothetical protein